MYFPKLIPESLTFGNWRKSSRLTRTLFLTSSPNLYESSFTMLGLSVNVLRADTLDILAVHENSFPPRGLSVCLLRIMCPLSLLDGGLTLMLL